MSLTEWHVLHARCDVCGGITERSEPTRRLAHASLKAAGWTARANGQVRCPAHPIVPVQSFAGQCTARGGIVGRCPNRATALCESVRILAGGRRQRVWLARCEKHLMNGPTRELDRSAPDGDASRVLFTGALP